MSDEHVIIDGTDTTDDDFRQDVKIEVGQVVIKE